MDQGSEGQRACEAAFALVLARHLSTDDVAFGVQCHAADGSMIPPFVQRGSCDDELAVGEFIARLGRVARSAPTVTDGFGSLNIPVLTVEPHRDGESASAASAPSAPRHAPASAWLQVTVSLVGEPQLLAVYDGDRCVSGRALPLLASFQHTLAEVLRDPAQLLGQVRVLPLAEEARILMDWNQTAQPFPDNLCIHELFERRAELQPDAPALEADGAVLTYRQLDERANQIAHALRARGVQAGDHVGVCLERSANLVAALLGTVKAGAVYIPLDPSYPAGRLQAMVSIARTTLVLTETQLRHLFHDGTRTVGGELLALDASWSPHFALRSHRRLTSEGEAARQPTDPCYVIFTSGSTGEPKGVVMSHRAVVNTLDWVSRTCAIGPGDRCLFVSSASFDLSVYDVFGALGAGATLVMASTGVLADPEALADALLTKRITIWNSAPATLERILPALASHSRQRGARTHLRKVLLSGDWIPVTLPGALRAIFPQAEVLALGGATEAAIWSNAYAVREVDPSWTSIPYGRPIQNARYHILDRRMQPAPVGVAGELYIGGVCLADGYLHRPELTAERFVSDPFQPGARLYRTGDLARYFPDGTIEFLGRADHQVKVRGFRVELGEVESALLKQPGVRAAACIARADSFGQKVLVGFIVPQREQAVNAAELLAGMSHLLPSYMVPSRLIMCEALPLSANGKVDRSALSALEQQPEVEAGAATETGSEPVTALERTLQLLWQELLGRPHVGLHDDFNALGGHSLLAVKMTAALRDRLNMKVPLAAIARHTTIARLAAHLAPSGAGTTARGVIDAGAGVCVARGTMPTDETPHLLELNPRRPGSRPPLVLVAGVGGYAFTYRNFPRLFGLEQPVYCFQSVGAELSEPLQALSIEEIAKIYEQELEKVLPEGEPVILGGFSFGALPAFELARRLERRGWPVPLLISFDGFAPGYPRLLPLPVRAMKHGQALLASEPEARRAYLAATGASVRARVMRALGREAELGADLPFDEERNARAKQLAVHHRHARDNYRPTTPITSRLLLLRIEQPEHWLGSDMDDPFYDWERYVRGPISMSTLPGAHTMLLDSHANQVAATDIIAKHVAQVATDMASEQVVEKTV